mgnify:CR=1 FL=1
MPSRQRHDRPCVRTSAPVSRFWILLLMSSLISDGFNCMIFPRALPAGIAARGPRVSYGIRFAKWLAIACSSPLHRAVDHRVADDDPGSADQRRIDA